MTGNRTHSGNKKPIKVRTCLYCKLVYKTRKNKPCPRCGRRHHVNRWNKILACAGLRTNYYFGFKN